MGTGNIVCLCNELGSVIQKVDLEKSEPSGPFLVHKN